MGLSSDLNVLGLNNCEADFEFISNFNESARLFNRVECWNYRHAKRGMDLTVALIMGFAFLIPAVAIAIAVVLNTPGPIFYREMRIGRNGKRFELWKFRSMNHRPCKSPESEPCDSREDAFRWRTQKNFPDPRGCY
jgi:lipopolysaccharide/colanic/teichoic acid biosynthesis glycosyltransferase